MNVKLTLTEDEAAYLERVIALDKHMPKPMLPVIEKLRAARDAATRQGKYPMNVDWADLSEEDRRRVRLSYIDKSYAESITIRQLTRSGMPEDVRILSYEGSPRGWCLKLWSLDFSPVEPGTPIPEAVVNLS
jgi:hypothetical protein